MKKITMVWAVPCRHIPTTTLTEVCEDSLVEPTEKKLRRRAQTQENIWIAPYSVKIEDFEEMK